MICKVLIQEASSCGCSATIEYIGSAMLEVHEVMLGLRVEPGPCGPSPTINRTPKWIKIVRLGDREYVVEANKSCVDDALKAKEDGCDWVVIVDKADGLQFSPGVPSNPILLSDDYR